MRTSLLWILFAGCTNGENDCWHTDNVTVDPRTADPALRLRIDACQLDVDACPALCAELSRRNGEQPPGTCKVTFDDDLVEVAMVYVASREAICGGAS